MFVTISDLFMFLRNKFDNLTTQCCEKYKSEELKMVCNASVLYYWSRLRFYIHTYTFSFI